MIVAYAFGFQEETVMGTKSSTLLFAAMISAEVFASTASRAENFTVCAGEYERNCGGSYEVYVYCYQTDNWANETCKKLNSTGEFTKINLRVS
jgi:hypothetical protein